MAKMHVKSGDKVVVLSGKDKGKEGTVLRAKPTEGKVLVEGVAVAKKAVRPNAQNQQGGIIEQEAFIDASNVMVVCPTCGKPTRPAASPPALATTSTTRARRSASARSAAPSSRSLTASRWGSPRYSFEKCASRNFSLEYRGLSALRAKGSDQQVLLGCGSWCGHKSGFGFLENTKVDLGPEWRALLGLRETSSSRANSCDNHLTEKDKRIRWSPRMRTQIWIWARAKHKRRFGLTPMLAQRVEMPSLMSARVECGRIRALDALSAPFLLAYCIKCAHPMRAGPHWMRRDEKCGLSAPAVRRVCPGGLWTSRACERRV